jgi:hypothetical protein
VCGFGQKGDDGSSKTPTPKWDGVTYLDVPQGEEPKCPMEDCHYLLEGPEARPQVDAKIAAALMGFVDELVAAGQLKADFATAYKKKLGGAR